MIHCPSLTWMWMSSSSSTEEGLGEAGQKEIQRAKGRAVGEWWISVCLRQCCCSALVRVKSMPKRAETTEVSIGEVQTYIVLCGEGTLVPQWE